MKIYCYAFLTEFKLIHLLDIYFQMSHLLDNLVRSGEGSPHLLQQICEEKKTMFCHLVCWQHFDHLRTEIEVKIQMTRIL